MEESENNMVNENKRKKIAKWKDILDIVHSISVILAILCAGVWFLTQGEIRPKNDITHEVTCKNIHKQPKK